MRHRLAFKPGCCNENYRFSKIQLICEKCAYRFKSGKPLDFLFKVYMLITLNFLSKGLKFE